MHECFASMHICVLNIYLVPTEAKEDTTLSETGVTDGYKLLTSGDGPLGAVTHWDIPPALIET